MRLAILGCAAALAVFPSVCAAEELSDDQLIEIATEAFERKFEVRNSKLGIQVLREAMEGLDDAERTRALVLRQFDIDEKDGRMRYNASSSTTSALMSDPGLIKDPSELKRMMAGERDVRRFRLLAEMAATFMISHKSDFVVETTPMLYRQESVARMLRGGEYYFHSLSNASYAAYNTIVTNLKYLEADFVPPDDKLPFEERIPILIEWLKENWPGCEHLSVPGTGQPHGRNGADAVGVAERPRARPEPERTVAEDVAAGQDRRPLAERPFLRFVFWCCGKP